MSPRNYPENITRRSTSTVLTGPAALREPAGVMFIARSEETAGDGPAASSSRAAYYRFRQSCAVLGAKAARAGGEAVAAAAAVASGATKEAIQSTTALVRDENVGGIGRHKTANKRRSQDEINEGVEEYWGSDYCTSV